MNEKVKLALILAAFASVACVSLAVVSGVTGPIRAEREEAATAAALKVIFPGAESFEEVRGSIPLWSSSTEVAVRVARVQIARAWLARIGDGIVGMVVEASGPSYNGRLALMAGIGNDRTIREVVIKDNRDTPGFGQKASSPDTMVGAAKQHSYLGQFTGKSVTDRYKAKADVDAISGSTITSRSIATILKGAGESAARYLETLARGGGK